MEDYRIISGFSNIRARAFACPECHQPPAVTFDQSSMEFKISCCGYSVEAEEAAVVLELWDDFVKEQIVEMEDKKEKMSNAIIAPCPRCGKIPFTCNVSRLGDTAHLISCCGVSKSRDEYHAAIEAWNDYSAEYQLKNLAKCSQEKISEVVKRLRGMLISKNQNYGNSAFCSPILLPHLKPEAALLVRMSDKVARLASLASGEKDRVGESLSDTLYDLAGYCVLAIIAMEEDSK